ncbi:MAG: T9SS type A sorting domain-containing protein, partial [Candidatus Cloacimonadaceae bacterium]
PQRVMMESFEKEINEVYLWQFTSGAAWQRTESAVDGKYCLSTPPLAQNQSSSAEISFHLGPNAPYYFHKLLYYLKIEGTAENHLRFYVNGVEKLSWSNVSGWQKAEYVLEEGATTLKWTYEQTGNPASGEDFALLDAIQFPAGTIFTDAVLETETEAINITVHPDQIIHAPVLLKSKDGRYIYYDTILQRDRGDKPKSDDAWLTFNQETFTPGKRNNYLVTLYNTYQNQVVTEAIISLQQTRALALSATNLSMSGEQPLTCTTFFPSFNLIYWSDDTGTTADSLRCVLALTTELDITTLPMLYHITLKDAEGFITNRIGSITLSADGASEDFLYIDPDLGSMFEQEVERLTLSCFEPTLPEDLSGYHLVIYYNGMNSLSLPINITYDPTPGFDTDKLSLKAYPNPFSQNLNLVYYLPGFDRAEFSVYNIKGQKVSAFQNMQSYPGENLLVWDGKDSQGKRLPSGVYIIKLRTDETGEKTARCLLLK